MKKYLLRPDEVQDVSRSAGHQVPDGPHDDVVAQQQEKLNETCSCIGDGDAGAVFGTAPFRGAQARNDAKLDAQKAEAVKGVDEMAKLAQEMVDSVFSFGELGMQEVETSRYLTAQLEKFGFKVTRGQSGMPTAWVATYGSGKPVIALGSDIDGIPQSSQKPGVAYHDPIVEGAPGHGEGHNTGMPLNIIAAIAVKRIMERDKLPGTIMLWPGVAEELVASKAWFVRDGMFKDVDVNLFTHVGNNLERRLGPAGRHRPGVDRVHVRRRDGAQRRRAVARPLGARRRRADEHRLAVSPRAPAAVAALALGRSPTAAISRTSCRATPASGSTSARSISRTSRSWWRSASRWPKARP